MKNNRFVPLISGICSLGAALWFLVNAEGISRYVFGVPLLAFGWVSLKVAFFANDREIAELTGELPLSESTKKKIEDML